MKKKIIIIVSAIFSFFVILCFGGVIYYNKGINSYDETVRNSEDKVNTTFIVSNGMSLRIIIDELYKQNLIKDKYIGYIYVKLHPDIVLQAGKYELNRGMSLEEIILYIQNGHVIDESIAVTFVEGIKLDNFLVDKNGNVLKKNIELKSYAKTISKNFDYTEDEVIEYLQDRDNLVKLIDKYWFLTDEILNDSIYYALEGYLSADTYHFNKDEKLEIIIDKMLQETGKKLEPYKDKINESRYTVHEMMTLASIIEKEADNSDDRAGVAGVFYNRLEAGWSLGSDVTTYYGAKVEMADRDLYQEEIDTPNQYNTRHLNMAGKLPVSPICSPSLESIKAAFEPKEHEYYYFVADKNGKTYFNVTNEEHNATILKLKRDGLWYEYS